MFLPYLLQYTKCLLNNRFNRSDSSIFPGQLFVVSHVLIISSWLVVSTHLKNISQNGNLPQVGMKIKNV